jgi:hypothetical protein
MRFDVSGPVAGVQPAQPFDLAQQEALDAALRAHWAANVAPVVPSPTLNRDVRNKLFWGSCLLVCSPHSALLHFSLSGSAVLAMQSANIWQAGSCWDMSDAATCCKQLVCRVE